MWVQTIVPIAANSNVPLIPSNPKRQRLRWQVSGAGAVAISPAPMTAVGQGFLYSPNVEPEQFILDTAQDAFYAWAASASTVIVWEFVANTGIIAANNASL